MGHWEDFWWDTSKEIQELGLKKAFDKQLEKMDTQDKHRYKDTRQRWEYAKTKVINNLKKEKNEKSKTVQG